jgi:hypothetical protein
MEKKFKTLRIIASIYKLFGVLTLAGTMLFVLLIFLGGLWGDSASGDLLTGILDSIGGFFTVGLGVLFYGGGLAITLYALGEGVELFLALEENTRATAIALQRLSARQSQPPPQQVSRPAPPQPENPNSLLKRANQQE